MYMQAAEQTAPEYFNCRQKFVFIQMYPWESFFNTIAKVEKIKQPFDIKLVCLRALVLFSKNA
ncbi:hypothetical protein C9980_04850 [Vibrio mediterranei]|uniref:Uncharacterized protein n=1 Tax=Vibrio mediterranei TaxID=689 RepID=A0ABX5DME7_9VIBR|nr:hypothetical protein COR52_02380 [Vibrio mediterranei]PRQ69515.1 hypothetical protein COR51_02675 [Vibrio mediterranei]PTC06076.1 hypothetical protein C9980_04850 [Vibrio mediterranei]